MEPTRLVLRFYDPLTTTKFKSFCLRISKANEYERDEEVLADVFTIQFENKTSRSKFISAWARESMEVIK